MTGPRKWSAGVADEVWKVVICARDVQRAEDLLSGLAYILDNPGAAGVDGYADVIRRFSGAQIADALIAYREAALQSVANGLGRET